MDSSGERLHPNWQGLAKVHIPFIRFTHAAENGQEPKSIQQKYEIDGVNGEEVQKFYQEVLESPATSRSRPKPQSVSTTRAKASPQLPFDKNKFFRLATANSNLEELSKMSISSAELNVQDSYGWTALMMAACEGADTIAAWLLEMGADIGVADKSGHTALTLARRKGHAAIVELLEKERNDLEMEDEEVASEASEASVTPFYCDICQRSYCESTWRAHQTSTVHQFNANPAIFNKLQKFNISTKNRGLRIMVKQGWDREHGLGPQQNGRLYPIKTVLRKERNGLGIEQSPARVTHFSAFDTNATKRRNPVPREQRRTRNDMQREKVRERKRERRLRNELS